MHRHHLRQLLTLPLLLLPTALPLLGQADDRPWSATTGAGPAVVLLPGTNLDSRSFDQQVAALAAHHLVVRLDPRGLGRSPVPRQPFDSIGDVIAVLDAHGIDRAALIGQSGGAALAVDVALAAPDRVSSLVLIAPGLSGFTFPSEELERFQVIARIAHQQGHLAAVERMLEDPYLETVVEQPAVLQRVRALFLANDQMWNPDTVALAAASEPAIGRLGEIRVPTLVLVGSRDLPHIQEIAALLANSIEGARLETITGRGHLLQMEAPGQVNAALDRFFGDLAPPPAP